MVAAKYDSTDGRIRGRKLQARRLRLWSKDPRCAKCGKLTDYPSGFEADHVIPLAHNGVDNDSNLQILCIPCHEIKTIYESHNGDHSVQFFPEWLRPSIADLTIVFGAPGSGKSHYVESNCSPDDLVIDLDKIVSDLSGEPIYMAEGFLRSATIVRNKLLARLNEDAGKKAWFITTGTGKGDREWWLKKLQPKAHVVMDTPADECKRRVKMDRRRPKHVVERHLKAIDEWFYAEKGFIVKTARKIEIGLDGWPA